MPDAPLVQPLAPATAPEPVVTPSPEAPQQAPEAPPEAAAPASLSPDLLKVPAFQALFAGAPPALSMKVKGTEDRDEVKMVKDNAQSLQEAGMGFYLSLNKEFGVMFNSLRIHPQDLQNADKAGKLLLVAPDFDAVNHAVSKAGLDHPALHADAPPQVAASPSAGGAAPQMASGKFMPPLPAGAQRKLMQQRILNMQNPAPTGGPAPGAGILTNQILKNVV